MVSFREALELLLAKVPAPMEERCRVEQASGRVLRQELRADRDFPAFDRVMMDGYALRFEDWRAGCRTFAVTGTAPAGAPQGRLAAAAATCLEVMTGAPCPAGADCIVPVEEVELANGAITIAPAAELAAGEYLHRAGSDARQGEVLLEAGCLLGSREIGVAASCGAGWLTVARRPRIAVVATGDELVAVDEMPQPWQIRQSNGHALAAALARAGHAPASMTVLRDEAAEAAPVLEKLLEEHDWLVLTGAVSMGGRDFVPQALGAAGCHKVFHGMAQRPGKPVGFWTGPAGQVVLALPGNPVSALTGLHALALPALAAATGAVLPELRRVSFECRDWQLAGATRHLPVSVPADGPAVAAATGNSGDFIGLLRSDGFLTLPPRSEGDSASGPFPFTPWL